MRAHIPGDGLGVAPGWYRPDRQVCLEHLAPGYLGVLFPLVYISEECTYVPALPGILDRCIDLVNWDRPLSVIRLPDSQAECKASFNVTADQGRGVIDTASVKAHGDVIAIADVECRVR